MHYATHLIEASIRVAALVAATCSRGRDPVFAKPWGSFRTARLSKLAAACVQYHRPLVGSDELGERLLATVRSAWQTGDPRRRPDVLDITAQLLAAPSRPETLDLTRFCITLALRALYGVRHDAETLDLIRVGHQDLARRFRQQARRERRPHPNGPNVEQLLLDVLSMHGHVRRSMSQAAVSDYYDSFQKHPLGVDRSSRTRPIRRDLPQLKGDAADFPTLVNMLFAQPTCVVGLDRILGGMLPTTRLIGTGSGGGQVTLVAGAAGSGKTTLCLSIAARAAELGAQVRYVATEESEASLRAKLTSTGGGAYLTEEFGGGYDNAPDFAFVDGKLFTTLPELHGILRGELRDANDLRWSPDDAAAFLPFTRFVVIDSLSVLLDRSEDSAPPSGRGALGQGERREIAGILSSLRELGVSVWLVGGEQESRDVGLEYLVDNVLVLGTDPQRSARHPLRTLTVEKTRLQTAHRGRHILHLSRSEGIAVSPSLHAVVRELHDRPKEERVPYNRALLFGSGSGTRTGTSGGIEIRCPAQILVHGRGSAGKARFAVALALSPLLPVPGTRASSRPGRTIHSAPRVLVVSFLYPHDYYAQLVGEAVAAGAAGKDDAIDPLRVLSFYPGFIDPETVVAKVARALESAHLAGRPFTALILDGVHNVLLQFPLLEAERLLWPALSQLARAHRVRAITTFTFFEANSSGRSRDAGPSLIDGSREIFFHLLVSSADYSFVVERNEGGAGADRDMVRVTLAASVDGFGDRPDSFIWDPKRFRQASSQSARSGSGRPRR